MYKAFFKRILDIFLSGLGILFMAFPMMVVSMIIFLEDPGPVIFKQKRIGIHKRPFMLYKFRSMKMNTPHDMPTHLLKDPEQYLLKSGRFFRKTSIDEIPQFFNILKGDMSVIGPRPALWNQDDLLAERDKYGANDIKPGLTGWAQINGRDELEIEEKARLDGEYVKKESFLFDVHCFLATIGSVLKQDGIVEGGTGAIEKEKRSISYERVPVSDPQERNILIVGKDSYIGDNIVKYLNQTSDSYHVSVIDAIGLTIEKSLFSDIDAVINVAGIVHKKEKSLNKSLYYSINRDFAVALAKEAKAAGVKHFIQMSTMNVYGLVEGQISLKTKEAPTSAYGDSKYQADVQLLQLQSESFAVSIVRPPMVYGKGCKGNYQVLRKLALMTPVFPDSKNTRSMIYVENLCEFLRRLVDGRQGGIFIPQNTDYVNTSQMVKQIALCHGKKVFSIGIFAPILKRIPLNSAKKAFGSLYYEKIDTVDTVGFYESIALSERE